MGPAWINPVGPALVSKEAPIPPQTPPQTPPAGRTRNLAKRHKSRKSGILIPKIFVSAFPSPHMNFGFMGLYSAPHLVTCISVNLPLVKFMRLVKSFFIEFRRKPGIEYRGCRCLIGPTQTHAENIRVVPFPSELRGLRIPT